MDQTIPETPISFLLLFVFTGLLLVGLAIPLMLRRVKPNWWYGFRTRKTLSDERIWYESNAYVGKDLLILGIVHTAASLVLYVIPVLRANLVAYSSAVGVIFLIIFVVAIVKSFRFLNSL